MRDFKVDFSIHVVYLQLSLHNTLPWKLNLQFQSTLCVFLCYSSCLTDRISNVFVIDVIEGGSGSGLSPREQLTTELPTEVAGQLYAYRLNDSAAVLRTREWQPFRSSEIAAIGLQEAGDGIYICAAENANEVSNRTVTIRVAGV